MVQLEREKIKLREDIAKLKVCVCVRKESVLDGFYKSKRIGSLGDVLEYEHDF